MTDVGTWESTDGVEHRDDDAMDSVSDIAMDSVSDTAAGRSGNDTLGGVESAATLLAWSCTFGLSIGTEPCLKASFVVHFSPLHGWGTSASTRKISLSFIVFDAMLDDVVCQAGHLRHRFDVAMVFFFGSLFRVAMTE